MRWTITASADRHSFEKAGEVAHVYIDIVDENGIPVKLADNEITVRVSGPAELLALESGDNFDMGSYRDNRQRVYRGKLLGYIRAIEAGPVTITFTSPLLESATLRLK